MSKLGIFLIGGLALGAVLYQLLERVPSDALNVALGVLCGIGASIPVSLGLLIALTRQRQQNGQPEWNDPEPEPVRYAPQPIPRMPEQAAQAQQQPQIIVIAPPQGGQFPQGFQMPAQWTNGQYPFMHENSQAIDAREWRIIGEE